MLYVIAGDVLRDEMCDGGELCGVSGHLSTVRVLSSGAEGHAREGLQTDQGQPLPLHCGHRAGGAGKPWCLREAWAMCCSGCCLSLRHTHHLHLECHRGSIHPHYYY